MRQGTAAASGSAGLPVGKRLLLLILMLVRVPLRLLCQSEKCFVAEGAFADGSGKSEIGHRIWFGGGADA